MPTEIIESKEIYRGFIALGLATLRLADGARVSREIIEHGKAAVALPNDARRGAGGQAPVLGDTVKESLSWPRVKQAGLPKQ